MTCASNFPTARFIRKVSLHAFDRGLIGDAQEREDTDEADGREQEDIHQLDERKWASD